MSVRGGTSGRGEFEGAPKGVQLSLVVTNEMKELQEIAAQFDKGQAREIVFTRLSSMLATQEKALTQTDEAMLDQMLLDVVSYIEMSIRAKVAKQLSECEHLPEGILSYLCHDEIEVARSLLMHSPALSDENLKDIVCTEGKAHRLAIVQRPELSEAITEVIVDRSEPEVILKLMNNPGAHLSKKSTSDLVDLSENVEALRRPLLNRSELDPAQAQAMFWWVSATLRADILKRFHIDATTIDDALREATESSVAEAFAVPQVMASIKLIAQSAGGERLQKFMTALKNSKLEDLDRAFAALLSVDIETARRVLQDPGGESLAVACKAMRLDRQQFTRFFLLIDGARSGSPTHPSQLQRINDAYDIISEEEALHTLQFWSAKEQLRAA